MHYRNANDMPKYLFGERMKQHHMQQQQQQQLKDDQIYLNKSGWVQVNQRGGGGGGENQYGYAQSAIKQPNDSRKSALSQGRDSAFYKYGNGGQFGGSLMANKQHGNNGSKIEALISRSEMRRADKKYAELKYAIDPQVSALLSERPGFLPIKRFNDNESPPPITPIISPPPAFQDSTMNAKQNFANSGENAGGPKGMVFSRSFEYDNRKSHEYNQTFSKSFDYDFSNAANEEPTTTFSSDRIFTNLTGVSPNYLSKKPNSLRIEAAAGAGASRDKAGAGSVYQQYLEPKTYAEPNVKSRVQSTYTLRPEVYSSSQEHLDRPRRQQFSKQESGSSSDGREFRAAAAALHQSTVNKRLNSCDSGARSGEKRLKFVFLFRQFESFRPDFTDLSNDEVDDEDQPPSKSQRSRFLTSQHHSLIRKQRSLTPENQSDEKSRLLTPEKRNHKSSNDGSQGSLYSKENASGSRTSTLERPSGKFRAASSRSSSSSSCSGTEHEPAAYRRAQQRQNGRSMEESRIRRSR